LNRDRPRRGVRRCLPSVLHELYSAFDGFEGPTTANFFYPLIQLDSPEEVFE